MTEIIKLYTTKETAEHLRLSHEFVRKLAREHKVPCRKIRNKFYFTANDINHILGGE